MTLFVTVEKWTLNLGKKHSKLLWYMFLEIIKKSVITYLFHLLEILYGFISKWPSGGSTPAMHDDKILLMTVAEHYSAALHLEQ